MEYARAPVTTTRIMYAHHSGLCILARRYTFNSMVHTVYTYYVLKYITTRIIYEILLFFPFFIYLFLFFTHYFNDGLSSCSGRRRHRRRRSLVLYYRNRRTILIGCVVQARERASGYL